MRYATKLFELTEKQLHYRRRLDELPPIWSGKADPYRDRRSNLRGALADVNGQIAEVVAAAAGLCLICDEQAAGGLRVCEGCIAWEADRG